MKGPKQLNGVLMEPGEPPVHWGGSFEDAQRSLGTNGREAFVARVVLRRPMARSGPKRILLIDEDAKLRRREYNAEATHLLQALRDPTDSICGPAILLDEGEDL